VSYVNLYVLRDIAFFSISFFLLKFPVFRKSDTGFIIMILELVCFAFQFSCSLLCIFCDLLHPLWRHWFYLVLKSIVSSFLRLIRNELLLVMQLIYLHYLVSVCGSLFFTYEKYLKGYIFSHIEGVILAEVSLLARH